VFARYHIDFCCGGAKTLSDACDAAAIDGKLVLREIQDEIALAAPGVALDTLSPAELVEHVMNRYHATLPEELLRLEGMAEKVSRVHAAVDGDRLSKLYELVKALRQDLLPHLRREETILFPLIMEGQWRDAAGPTMCMEQQHDTTGQLLRSIRAITGDYKIQGDACMTWRALWSSLENLEAELHAHIAVENNVLFPKVMSAAGVSV
jgi:regulator of cell morphogenesis and NO signaling